MSETGSTPASVAPVATTLRWRSRRWRLGNARIRTKLALILLVPLLAIGVLAAARLVEAVDRAVEADQVRALAGVAVQASELGHELHQERIAAVRLLAGGDAAEFTRQTVRTDAAIAGYQTAVAALPAVPDVVRPRLAAIDAHLAGLVALRQRILSDPSMSVSAALLRYRAMLVDVGAYQATLPAVVTDAELAERTRAVAAIASAAGHAADAEAVAQTAVATGALTAAQREALRATQTGQREAFVAFGQTASAAQRAIVEHAITGANVDTAEAAVLALLDETAVAPDRATAARLSGMADLTRYVGRQLYDNLLDELAATHAAQVRRVIVESVAVTVVLAAAVVIAVLLARALASALHRLRAAAVGVAHTELPAAVARLADPQALGDTSPAQLAAQIVVPDRLHSSDEIGEVASALYEVHRTAVHLAAEQALLRTSLSAMMVNLARRSQTLVDTMISRLDQLQRDETDAARLQQMMALDSLATRMRRNDENLLVLAGADSSPPRTRDALAIDVLRAAQSEIEQFHRVEFGVVDDDVLVAAAAVNDVVRLLAELLDNATRFSGPDTVVFCEARRLGHQLVIQIEDRGVGMTPEGTYAINAMLANPRPIDATTVRKMGVAVVARLAARHHIHVHLQAHRHYGTIATVALPATVLVLPTGRHHLTTPPGAPLQSPSMPSPAGPSTSGRSSSGPTAPARPRRAADVARHHAGRRSSPASQTDATMPLPAINGQLADAGAAASRSTPWSPADTPRAAVDTPRLPKRVPQALLPG
ncbi:MAG: nitrate- and nitrite sensing domain-containing protein, partial [Micromonosporaceae bacterium]|nr:nitrate- and nitrite sensing domain-containing protein [Micromonosporaceae bacterium]